MTYKLIITDPGGIQLNPVHFVPTLRSGSWSTVKPLFQDSIQQGIARLLLQDASDLYEVEEK